MGGDIPLEKPPIPGPIKPSTEKGFVIVGNAYSSGSPSDRPEGIEIRTGATNDDALKKLEERHQQELKGAERTKDWTDVEWGADWIEFMFHGQDSYSETYQTGKDGTFDLIREDGYPVSPLGRGTPEKFYQTASEIQKQHPDWHFEFDVDPSMQRFKYTVTKIKPENK